MGLVDDSAVALKLASDGLGGAPTDWRVISAFEMQEQRQSNWCWAAVASSIARFYENSSLWSQCQLVQDQFNCNSCCSDGLNGAQSSTCNRPWYLDKALERVERLRMPPTAGDASLNQIRAEIDANCPIGVRVGWSAFSGHFVTIVGYSTDDGGWVRVNDPYWGDSTYERSEFVSRYRGTGAWTHTYWIQPSKGNTTPAEPDSEAEPPPEHDWLRWPFP